VVDATHVTVVVQDILHLQFLVEVDLEVEGALMVLVAVLL
jgi:hypothetical protein